MRRIMICTVCLLVCSCIYASAEIQVTQYRNAFEFCDLLNIRLVCLRDYYDMDAVIESADDFLYDNYFNINFHNEELADDQYYAATQAGDLLIEVPGFEVKGITACYTDFLKDDADRMISLTRALAVISVLEYNEYEELLMKTDHYIDKTKPADPIIAAFDIVEEYFFPYTANSDGLIELMDGPVLVYSGNYDYYLEYCVLGEEYNVIYLYAEAR